MVPGLLVSFVIQNKPFNSQLLPIPAAVVITSLGVNLAVVVALLMSKCASKTEFFLCFWLWWQIIQSCLRPYCTSFFLYCTVGNHFWLLEKSVLLFQQLNRHVNTLRWLSAVDSWKPVKRFCCHITFPTVLIQFVPYLSHHCSCITGNTVHSSNTFGWQKISHCFPSEI